MSQHLQDENKRQRDNDITGSTALSAELSNIKLPDSTQVVVGGKTVIMPPPRIDPSTIQNSPKSHQVDRIRLIAANMGVGVIFPATTREQIAFTIDSYDGERWRKNPQDIEAKQRYLRHMDYNNSDMLTPHAEIWRKILVCPNGLDTHAIYENALKLAKKDGFRDYHGRFELDKHPEWREHFALHDVVHEIAHFNDPDRYITKQEERAYEAGSDIAAYIVGKAMFKDSLDSSSNLNQEEIANIRARWDAHETFYKRLADIRQFGAVVDSEQNLSHDTSRSLRYVMSNPSLQDALISKLKKKHSIEFLNECDAIGKSEYLEHVRKL